MCLEALRSRSPLGCQFREHVPDERLATDAAVVGVFTQFRDIVAMKPPQLVFPERVTRLVAREAGDDNRLQGKEVFWWDGIQLIPPRQPLGLLGKLYTSNTKFNPNARPGSPALAVAAQGSLMSVSTATGTSPERREAKESLTVRPLVQTATVATEYEGGSKTKKGIVINGAACSAGAGDDGSEDSGGESGDSGESSERSSGASEEEPPPRHGQRDTAERTPTPKKRGGRICGRQWVSSQSARSNQDGQRRFEERALRQMKAALARRAPSSHQLRQKTPTGGVYARLEAEWREKYGAPRTARGLHSGRPRQQQALKYK
ncbi:hypothetical protein EVAR_82638_1 [Eumeta japonica]|uniref:Uncharacterized protein n=1 Tax=Eumeta variegata TaxID=151549 RepID=A0A4C1VCN6_EUMVA|nr:hypothetical protein EVAR_82638_1 [Eumeta japonica]